MFFDAMPNNGDYSKNCFRSKNRKLLRGKTLEKGGWGMKNVFRPATTSTTTITTTTSTAAATTNIEKMLNVVWLNHG